MIYDPMPVLNLRLAAYEGLYEAAELAALDFIAQENKPWAYYAGAALGYTAAATSIPGAVATLYFVGETLDANLLHSPDGSTLRLFLDGTEYAAIDTFIPTPTWTNYLMTGLDADVLHRLDIVNEGPSQDANASGIPFAALGAISVSGQGAYAQGAIQHMADVLTFHLRDSETDTRGASVPFYIASGNTVADLQEFANAAAPIVDNVTGSIIDSVTVTISLSVPGGLKAVPVTNVVNERGGLITFDTSGNRAESVRIPAIKPTIMSGNEFSLAETNVAALIGLLTTTATYGTADFRPQTPYGYDWVSARKGRKSFRK